MSEPTDERNAAQQEIAAVNRRFEASFAAGNPGAVARELYAREAVVLPPGSPAIRGRDGIAGFWDAAARQLGIEQVQLATHELEVYGDRAHEIGEAVLGLAGGRRLTAKYVVVWKREDGRWRLLADIWNGSE